MLFSIKKQEKSHMIQFVPILLLLSVILIFALSATQLTADNRAHEREIVSNALERSITQCYALEGSYPPNLSYLCDHYGFTYNKKHFFFFFQYIGSNLRPDVTIIEQSAEN